MVEVLLPSTEAYDRGEKFDLYRARPSIQEYVLVNMRKPLVEVYRRGSEDLWTLRNCGARAEVELGSVGVRIPVVELYEGVDVPLEAGLT